VHGRGLRGGQYRFSNDSRLLVGWTGPCINVWDIQTGLILNGLAVEHGYGDTYWNIQFSPNGTLVCFAYRNNDIKVFVWDTRDNSIQLIFIEPNENRVVECWFLSEIDILINSGYVVHDDYPNDCCIVKYVNHRRSLFSFLYASGLWHKDGDLFLTRSILGILRL